MPALYNLSFQTWTATVPTPAGPAMATNLVHVPIGPGDTILVAGPNGVGKSALLATLYRSLPQHVATYLPGHRQINFNNGWETLGQDAAQLRQNLFSQTDAFSRHKGAWAEDQFKITVRTLLHAEAAFNRDFRHNGPSNNTVAANGGTLRISPVDTLNLIFETARLPISFSLTDQGLSAVRGAAIYAIDALSDGERAALFIVAAIVILAPGGVILIDEPEKHLHPCITGLLIEAALRAKKDAMVVLASHDVHLIEQLEVTSIIHITDSAITNLKPEHRVYHAAVISNPDSIPEDLKRDLLGTRSSILFVEGDHTSADIALYGHVYPLVKVAPKGGHSQVSDSVKALAMMPGQHWIKPFGLIDGDGRDANEVDSLKKRGVFVLPCPTIENLFCLPEAIYCFVTADNEYTVGKPLEERVSVMDLAIRTAVIVAKADIIAKRSCWLLERELSSRKLSPKEIKEGNTHSISVSVDEIISSVTTAFDKTVADSSIYNVLFKLPIKNTPIPSTIATALGASSFNDYCRVILRQLDIKSDSSMPFIDALRAQLPKLL